MKTIAVDFGGSRIKIGLIEDGRILRFAMENVPVGCRFDSCLDTAEKKIRTLLTAEELNQVKGLGMSYPGLVNRKEKRVIQSNEKYSDAENFDIKQWIRERFSLPFILENDANAAILGELNYGCAAGCRDAVMMILGTGVGTAAVMDGKLVRGKHYQAGCLGGHFPIGREERKCTCPGTDCVEAYSGTWALPELVKTHPLYHLSGLSGEKVINFEVLKRYVDKQDAAATDVLKECIISWSKGIITLIYAYDPETVILSGGVMNLGDIIMNPIREYVYSHAWTPWGKVQFKTAENKEHSVLLGLHYLMKEELYSK